MTLDDLIASRDALKEARASGARRVVTQTGANRKEVEYRSDAELQAALDAIEREIAAMSGKSVRVTYVASSKGV